MREAALCQLQDDDVDFYFTHRFHNNMPWPLYRGKEQDDAPTACLATLLNVLSTDTGVFSHIHSMILHPKYVLAAGTWRQEMVSLSIRHPILSPLPHRCDITPSRRR